MKLEALSPCGQKGLLRVGRKWMIRLGGKSDNVLVSQVKVLKQALWTSTVHDRMPVILGATATICGSIRA